MAYDIEVQSHESPKKRPFPSNTDTPLTSTSIFVGPTSPHSTDSPLANQTAVLPTGASREPSPALSITSSLTSISNIPVPLVSDGNVQLTGQSPSEPAAKRRKLTLAEKTQRQAEKAEKERQRSEEKLRRDEEKQAKDEERRQKAEIKEEKKREKELEKQQKEEEKRRKDEEKENERRRKEDEEAKKTKAQSRLHNFFQKPAQPKPPHSPKPSPSSALLLAEPGSSHTPSTSICDYDRSFLPFSPPSHSHCAPISRFTWDEEALRHLLTTFDNLTHNSHATVSDRRTIRDCLSFSSWKVNDCAPSKQTVKQIMARLSEPDVSYNGSVGQNTSSELLNQLREIPMKYIYFHQDVRPPFVGTYTKNVMNTCQKRAARNPFLKVRIDTDYDYDSEAEWEEPEDGEELDSEGESDAESVDTTEDMEGFLDDRDTADGLVSKRGLIVSDMEAISSGISWEDEHGKLIGPDNYGLRSCRLVVIEDSHHLPIDPFSTAYWTEIAPTKGSNAVSSISDQKALAPPALQQRQSLLNAALGSQASHNGQSKLKSHKGPPRLMQGADLDQFKQFVNSSPHNKVGLLAILKKEKFPNYANAVLRDTLDATAKRVGEKEADKKWIIREDAPV